MRNETDYLVKWNEVKHLGGKKSDIYVVMTEDYVNETGESYVKGEYRRLQCRGGVAVVHHGYFWVQGESAIQEEKRLRELLNKDYDSAELVSGTPSRHNEFEVVWNVDKFSPEVTVL